MNNLIFTKEELEMIIHSLKTEKERYICHMRIGNKDDWDEKIHSLSIWGFEHKDCSLWYGKDALYPYYDIDYESEEDKYLKWKISLVENYKTAVYG